MKTDAATLKRVYAISLAGVYPHHVAKAEKKGRTKAEVDEIIRCGRPCVLRCVHGALRQSMPRLSTTSGDSNHQESAAQAALYDCPTSGGEGGTRRGICQLHPVDAARLSGQLFSEVRAAERPCAKYQQ